MQRVGKYEILGELGQGAMGTVRKARDPGLDRIVALKTMSGGAETEAESKERFLREARSAARLQHPNIITIFELGEVEGVPFIAMEYLEGRNLEDERAAGGLDELEAQLEVAEQLCRGLHYAHERGVVHRDVKPSNVFIQPDGTIKILDFGIARLEGGTFATRTGVVLGTPHYMAPEQFTDAEVDYRVDMWAAGVMLFEMITGRRPFEGASVPALIYQLLHADPPHMNAAALGVPKALVAVIEKCLARDPQHRFRSMREMGVLVRQILFELQSGGAAAQRVAGAVLPALEEAAATTAVTAHAAPATDPRTDPTAQPGALGGREKTSRLSVQSFREHALFGEREALAMVLVSPDERVLAVGGVDGSIRLWDLKSRMKLTTLRSRIHLRTGHAARTTAMCYSQDGSLLASGHLDGSVYLWELRSGFEFEARMSHQGAVHGLVFSPDSGLLISAGNDATLKYWDLQAVLDGEARRQLRRQPAECTALAISRDGSHIVSGHANRALRVHDTASGRLTATLHGHHAAPCTIVVSRRDDLVVSGSRNGTIRLFRLDSRAQLRALQGHAKGVSSLAFLHDGRHFVSVASDRSLLVWRADESEPLAALVAQPDEALVSVCCLARSRQLLCGLSDGRFRLWGYGEG